MHVVRAIGVEGVVCFHPQPSPPTSCGQPFETSQLGFILLAFVGWLQLSRPYSKISEFRAAYAMTGKNETADSVILKMGTKEFARNTMPAPYWDDERLPDEEQEKIVRTLSYSVDTFFLGVTFSFGFDVNNRLIGKHIYD
jgi:hypothetical protein